MLLLHYSLELYLEIVGVDMEEMTIIILKEIGIELKEVEMELMGTKILFGETVMVLREIEMESMVHGIQLGVMEIKLGVTKISLKDLGI